MSTPADIRGLLRRIRRYGDLSQRQLAAAMGVSQSVIARTESGTRELPLDLLLRAATVVGLRVALVDAGGAEVPAMTSEAVRDMAGRLFPAHLDTRHRDAGWWHGDHRYHRPEVWYTFDRDRRQRDAVRAHGKTPLDHLEPGPDDSPAARRQARRDEARRAQRAEWERRRDAGELPAIPAWICDCPPDCPEDDAGIRSSHADACACRCDLG